MKKNVLYTVDIHGDHSRIGVIDKVGYKWCLLTNDNYIWIESKTKKSIIDYFMTNGYVKSYYIKTED